jgi:hypothetical protein
MPAAAAARAAPVLLQEWQALGPWVVRLIVAPLLLLMLHAHSFCAGGAVFLSHAAGRRCVCVPRFAGPPWFHDLKLRSFYVFQG